jgi:centromeric protein E
LAYQEGFTASDQMDLLFTASDQMDLLIEQIKMLAGEVAFGTSSLKRLIEQSIEDPEGAKDQVCPLLSSNF